MKKLVKQYVIEIFEVENSGSFDKNELKEELAGVIQKVIVNKEVDKIQKLLDARTKRFHEIMAKRNGK